MNNSLFFKKVEFFSSAYLRCCIFIADNAAAGKKDFFTKKLYSKLIGNSVLLEDFLDIHGAKDNSNWYFYRELAAAVRHLSLAGYAQKHISTRLEFYELEDMGNFEEDAKENFIFLNNLLIKLAPVILKEAKRLNIYIQSHRYKPEDFMHIPTGVMLEYDIQDENQDVQKKYIVKIASQFLSVAKDFNKFRFYEPYLIEDIKKIVPNKINEVEMRRFEMLVHNIQSSFDSYVMHGRYRVKESEYKRLRSNFSIVFHLTQEIGRLLHFYERHLYQTGYKNAYKRTRQRLSEIIPPDKLLDKIVNYGVFYASHFLEGGKALAKKILNDNIERKQVAVSIPKDRGFHSRPSLLVAKIVRHYGGEVKLMVKDASFDASSVLDIQWAGGKIEKDKIEKVVFEGDSRAIDDIKILASVNYAEDTMGKGKPLPSELGYLK
ncbi:MAG: HPr family phosphocarrier protein [Deltaproteobacteria bacterium]|nr:HPr family phosphocarrier protein [Deltaproteobacteria bacterium]